MPESVTKPDPSWWAKWGRTSLFVGGMVLSFACPYLPPAAGGPCRIISSALRSGLFDGQPIPLPSDVDGAK